MLTSIPDINFHIRFKNSTPLSYHEKLEQPLVHVAVDHGIVHRVGHCQPVDAQVYLLQDRHVNIF